MSGYPTSIVSSSVLASTREFGIDGFAQAAVKVADRQAFGPEPEIVADLHRLLLVEVGGAEDRENGAVAEAGEAEQLAPDQSAPAAERLAAAVLDVHVDIGRRALDGDVADDVAGGRPRRTKSQPDGVTGEVARKKQVALRVVAVEHRVLGQLAEIAGDDPLGAAGVPAHANLGQMRHQHAEADSAVADRLLRHLHGRDIAGVAQDRAGAVADLAHDRDWNVLADIRRVGARQLVGGEAFQTLELGAAKDEVDRLIFRAVERAWRPFDSAFDLELGARERRLRSFGAGDFLARRRKRRRSDGRLRSRLRGRRACGSNEDSGGKQMRESAPPPTCDRQSSNANELHRGAPFPV